MLKRRRITDEQYRWHMTLRNEGRTQKQSASKVGISERSGRNLENRGCLASQRKRKKYRTRKDPLEAVWDGDIVPILEQVPQISCPVLLEQLQDIYPEKYSDSLLRTLQRRVRKWRAIHGPSREIMFSQEHAPGRQGLSDFTKLKGIEITIQGELFDHLLYHFRLAYSRWSWIAVVHGGESFTALSKGLQDGLWRLGGSPLEHRTDSLSAAFRNISRQDKRDLTRSYKELCRHYGMTPTRNNLNRGHENGSVESAHGHLKRRLRDSLALRGSYDFESVEEYKRFIKEVVTRHNRRNQSLIDVERQHLQKLPERRTIDYIETTARVTTSSVITVQGVLYTVPSQLIGHKLGLHVYDDQLKCYLGSDEVLTLPRIRTKDQKKRYVNYKHLIESLSRKPQAFRYSILRDDILPNETYRKIWLMIDQRCTQKQACRLIVGILKLAADYDCEEQLGAKVRHMLKKGEVPCLGSLQQDYQLTQPKEVPALSVQQHALKTYDHLLLAFSREARHA